MRNLLAAVLLALALGFAPGTASAPVLAAGAAEEDPEALMRESVEHMLRAIELMIEMIPQYEPPVVTEDGDIIIRRKRRPDETPDLLEEEET